MEAFCREHENALYQFQQGLFSAQEFSGRVENMRAFHSNPPFRRFWDGRQNHYSPSLPAEIDLILSELENQDAG